MEPPEVEKVDMRDVDALVVELERKFADAGLIDWLAAASRHHGYHSLYPVKFTPLTSTQAEAAQSRQSDVGSIGPVGREAGHHGLIGTEVTERFAEGTWQAIQLAHARGLAVPVRRNGAAVESRPDGTTAPINDPEHRQPTDWKSNTVS